MPRKTWTVGAVLASAMLVSGCGATARTVTEVTGRASPAAAVIAAAAQQLRAASSYTAAFSSAASANGQSERVTGTFDFRTQQSDQTIIATGGSTPADQSGQPVHAIASGRLLYLRLPADMRGGDTQPWTSLTASDYNAGLGPDGGSQAIKTPFSYGASGLRDQFAQYLQDGAATFTAAGGGTIDGASVTEYRGDAGPMTLTLMTPAHRTMREVVQRLGLTVWLASDRAGGVRRVSVRGVAADDNVITEQFTITSWITPAISAPPAAEIARSAPGSTS